MAAISKWLYAANDDSLRERELLAAMLMAHDGGMSDATLTDAKIAAAEARGDAKLERLGGRLDTFAATIDGKFDAVFAKLDGITNEQARLHDNLRGVSTQVSGARTTIITTAIFSVIGIVAALYAVLAYGGDQIGRGMEIRKAVDDAIQETIKRMPAQPVTIETDGTKR